MHQPAGREPAGSGLDRRQSNVIQPDFARDQVVNLLARQAPQAHHQELGLRSGPEIQKQRSPAVGAARQVVGGFRERARVVSVADFQAWTAVRGDAFRLQESLKA
jgi:hypothetical protein